MFGDWGTLLIQLLVTVVVVLGLIAAIYWLVRRYSAVGLGRMGRGRVPRLAIIDAMSVDGRRRLVLVRRDNVEHLILIGGPSDVVVEQAIQRQRRPKSAASTVEAESITPEPIVEDTRAAPTPSLPPPAPAKPYVASAQNGARGPAAEAERPFSFRRTSAAPVPPTEQLPPPSRSGRDQIVTSPARFVDLHRPTRVESAEGTAAPPPESEPLFPDLPTAELPPPADEAQPHGLNGSEPHPTDAGIGPPTEPPARSPYAKPESNGGDNGGKLADLENEMARLLGEITQKRHS